MRIWTKRSKASRATGLVRQTAAKILEVLMVVAGRAEGDLMTQEAREYFARLVRRANEVAPRAPEPARHITPFVLNAWMNGQKRLCQLFEGVVE